MKKMISFLLTIGLVSILFISCGSKCDVVLEIETSQGRFDSTAVKSYYDVTSDGKLSKTNEFETDDASIWEGYYSSWNYEVVKDDNDDELSSVKYVVPSDGLKVTGTPLSYYASFKATDPVTKEADDENVKNIIEKLPSVCDDVITSFDVIITEKNTYVFVSGDTNKMNPKSYLYKVTQEDGKLKLLCKMDYTEIAGIKEVS